MIGRRGVLAALVGTTLLAAVLLAVGLARLAVVAGRGDLTSLEAFGLALILAATALVVPTAVAWFAYRALDRQVEALTAKVDATPTDGTYRAFVVEGGGAAGELG